eukprot:TRINITY_DN23963_c0_g1_i1.p1 TRINITY_DN23963_c0_g1~~TRINITY_DN23963_c0_g1_i1.p1  ORF type:complete len:1164 (-),score=179.13 TRINITY_DN23963_c0_g1_i1:93-3584(-)
MAVRYAPAGAAAVVLGGGDSAAGPLTRRAAAAAQVSAQLRAISLEYQHSELAAATSNFHPSRRLGSGCYGAVFRGELKDGSEVAIKAIDLGILVGKGECPEDAGFDEEVQMLSKFRHPHLVTLLGWGQQGLNRYLVYEFLAGGDVFQRLHKSKTGQRTFLWHERLSVLLDAASGLSHMHNSTPKAFHRDIKSANILLDRHGTGKMADFGLSCIGQHGATNITVKTIGGTPGYKCPLYERCGRFTEGSEVYSFGMVMIEVITSLDPSSADASVPGGIVFPIAETIAPNTPGAQERLLRHPDSTANWPTALFSEMAPLGLRCTACPDERQRPLFVDLVKAFRGMVDRFPATCQGGVSQSTPCSAQKQSQLISQQLQTPQRSPQHSPQTPQQQQTPPPQQTPQQATAQAAGQPTPNAARQSPPPQLPKAHSPPAVHQAKSFQPQFFQQASPLRAQSPLRGQSPLRQQSPSKHRQSYVQVQARPNQSPQRFTPNPRNASPNYRHHGQQQPQQVVQPAQPQLSFFAKLESAASPEPPAFELELVATSGPSIDALPQDVRRLALCGAVLENGKLSASVGRHLQSSYFEAWLPDAQQRACISRQALEVSWAPGDTEAMLLCHGTNPVAVDGMIVAKGKMAPLKQGSQITFTYEGKVLLRLRFSISRERCTWSVDQTQQLSGQELQQARENRVVCLTGVASVAEAVDRLNEGKISCPSGFCIVYSATRSAYFLLYRGGCQPQALLALMSKEALARRETKEEPEALNRVAISWTPPPEPLPEPTPEEEPRHAAVVGPENNWYLNCVRAEGLSVEALLALPRNLREVCLGQRGSTLFGKNHQQTQFEALISDPVQRLNVSRSLCQFEADDDVLRVTNMSSNVQMLVDEVLLQKDATSQVREGQVLSFAKRTESAFVYLAMFKVTRRHASELPDSPKKGLRTLSVDVDWKDLPLKDTSLSPSKKKSASDEIIEAPGRAVPQLPPPQLAAQCQSDFSPGIDSTPVAKFFLPPPSMDLTHCQVKRGISLWPEDGEEGQENRSQPVILELSGAGVRDLPVEQRRIGPVQLGRRPLIVGRRHQKELLQAAVHEDCIDFISRDHFVIAYESSSFMFLALSQNRLWLFRDGLAPRTLVKEQVEGLVPGDRIVLGTGEQTAEDSCRRLCWHFRLANEEVSQ